MIVEGLIEADDCPNILSVTIGDNYSMSGVRPLVAHGVFGIVKVDGKFHFMMEDDCHFWTAAVISESDLKNAKEAVSTLIGNISVKNNKRTKRPDWGKAKIKPNHQSTIRKGDVVASFDRSSSVPLIRIKFEHQKSGVAFHPTWYTSLIKTLNLTERRPK